MSDYKHIPLDRLCFYNGDVKKADSYMSSYIVAMMPFDYNEIEGLSGDDLWNKMKDLSIQYLIKTGKIPTSSKSQDYVRTGSGSIRSYTDLVEIAKCYAALDQEAKPITVFNNAFDNIILPEGFKERIIETIAQIKDNTKIFDDWGLGDKIKKGKGVNLLFSGESGTGKTYCGEIIAEYIGTDAELVSVASLESKWIGESEKNVSQLFKSLMGGNKVLILDEVDSFLTSRGLVSQEYQSKLTNQFLIELERHNGICVMTTNRPVVLDRALSRRIDLVLDFPAPDLEARKRIWQYMIPKKMPVGKLDFDKLAMYDINGGLIKNAVLTAARKAVVRDIHKIETTLFEEAVINEIKEKSSLVNGEDFSKHGTKSRTMVQDNT